MYVLFPNLNMSFGLGIQTDALILMWSSDGICAFIDKLLFSLLSMLFVCVSFIDLYGNCAALIEVSDLDSSFVADISPDV